jgi:hypothetical protein
MIINEQRHVLCSNDQHVTGKRLSRGFRQGVPVGIQRWAKRLRLAHPSNATLPFAAVPASTEPDDVHPTDFGLKCLWGNQARGF